MFNNIDIVLLIMDILDYAIYTCLALIPIMAFLPYIQQFGCWVWEKLIELHCR